MKLDSDRLLAFLRSEAEERRSAMQPTDTPYMQAQDRAFLDALEVVAVYVEAAAERAAA